MKSTQPMITMFEWVCATAWVMVIGAATCGATTATSDGNWSDPGIWDDGVPDATKDAVIQATGGRTVTNNTTSTAKVLKVGADFNKQGVLVVEAGADLTASGTEQIIGYGNDASSGTVLQSGGYVRLDGETKIPSAGAGAQGLYRITGGELSFSYMRLLRNNNAPSTGRLDIVNGTVRSTSPAGLTVGWHGSGQGVLDQSGGELIVSKLALAYNAEGLYNLEGGTLSMPAVANYGFILVGDADARSGILRQSGGTLYLTDTNTAQALPLRVGDKAGGGDVHLTGGEMVHRSTTDAARIEVGRNATGVGAFYLGDATRSDGVIRSATGATALSLYIRSNAGADGEFRGWGDGLQMTGELRNHGRVVADGYGVDRELNMSRFAYLGSVAIANLADTGWYAVNRGSLRLPDIDVSAGASANVDWGLPTLSHVNSVDMTLNSVSSAGKVRIELLAVDHGDTQLPAGHTVIGCWRMSALDGLAFGTADIVFRYDDNEAASLSLNESELRLYRNSGSGWHELTAGITVDDTANTLSATGVNSFSLFAVAGEIPPAGTIFIVR